MLGNGRLEALCFDGEKRLAHIRGKLRKKVWINQGDIILLSLRDYQDEKGDVILKYSADEARSLKAYGELPESAKINETDTYVAFFSLYCFGRNGRRRKRGGWGRFGGVARGLSQKDGWEHGGRWLRWWAVMPEGCRTFCSHDRWLTRIHSLQIRSRRRGRQRRIRRRPRRQQRRQRHRCR